MQDHGPNPYVTDIEEQTVANQAFRTVLWSGKNLQVTLMTIQPGEDIGLEVHEDHDQFLRVEAGVGLVQMGPSQSDLSYEMSVEDDSAVFIPAGSWHNLTNTGDEALKLYSIYAPPEHKPGTVHQTKADAEPAKEK